MESSASFTKAATRLVIICLFTATCLFASAGTFRWWNAWLYLVAYCTLVTVLVGLLFRKRPDLAEERMTAAAKAKSWDRILVPILAAVLPVLSTVLAGLDRRFGWTHSITTVETLAGFGVMLAATLLTYWAMATNRFFSSHVRIQRDRGHTVVTGGPYAYIRHPGYTGTIIANLAAPIVLGSMVAFWVGVVMAALFTLRTVLEDRTLQAELEGYREYAGRVRYRLVPFVW